MIQVKGKKILVVGLGVSGIAAAKFLKQHGAEVMCTDSSVNDEIEKARIQMESLSIPTEIGGHTEAFLEDIEMVVTSPGVPPWSKPFVFAREKNIPVIGEIELAFRFCRNPVVAVTGSNGKSTTVTLIDEFFKNSGRKSRLCGNIGIPLIEEVINAEDGEILVTEVSSFQLETIDSFKPYVSVILNITPNHLDRYHSMEEYSSAKLRIMRNQDENCYSVLNANLKNLIHNNFKKRKSPRLIYFGKDPANDIIINSAKIFAGVKGFPHFELSRDEIKHLQGEHNAENIAAAIGAVLPFGIGSAPIVKTVKKFKGLEHRIEVVAAINGVRYINDSKATTVDALITALDTLGRNIILIAGGRNKGSDFTKLRKPVKENVKTVILIGESSSLIYASLYGYTEFIFADNMRDAVEKAYKIAKTGDTVLLSPACASFDMFKNFEERGEVFKSEVIKLKNKQEKR